MTPNSGAPAPESLSPASPWPVTGILRTPRRVKKEVDFLDCVAWNSTAELVEKYFRKGQMAVATGRLQIRQYTDKNGQKRRQAEILVSSVYFCGGKENGSAGGSESDSGYAAPAYQTNAPSCDFAELEDDDARLPF